MFNLNLLWIHTHLTLSWFSLDSASAPLTPEPKIERIIKKMPPKSDTPWVSIFEFLKYNFVSSYIDCILCRWQTVRSRLNSQRQFICQTLKWRRSCKFFVLIFFLFLVLILLAFHHWENVKYFQRSSLIHFWSTHMQNSLSYQGISLHCSPLIKLLTILSFRMADFSSTWGPPSDQGGYMLSQIKYLYKSPNMKWACKLSFTESALIMER